MSAFSTAEYLLATKLWIAWVEFYMEIKSLYASFFNFWDRQLTPYEL